ncbi:Hypothetical protein, putative [Bodo saltans]|uniref:Uncharacterized protein n=1 Tax=Bodo saltans TaxID=75058 RepID=A0A0S4IU70_BODSA|nr:Hypothetical protein, putative [Bodo saltans]|eukprot:CUF33317.1 Hypothetical protein, putative [Bodo saltans]
MQKNNTEIRDATVLRDLCIRTAQNVLVSWLRHARLFQRDGFRAPRQEAYHQFRSTLKSLNDEAKQRLVSSRNESKATNATPTDVFRLRLLLGLEARLL